MRCEKSWILTHSGRKFWPLDPDPEDVRIEDIAHALSNTCRYTGHTRFFYSVAEHSDYVSRFCKPDDALAGLLHDASEAYLCDIASPVKRSPIFEGYRAAEAKLQGIILERFGLPAALPASVLEADARMVPTEAAYVFHRIHEDWDTARFGRAYSFAIHGREPKVVESLFLKRFDQLYGRGSL